MTTRLHAVVHGHVQGVGFRYFVRDRARDLGLTGWVRNLADGTVEVMAEGERERLEGLLGECREGPPMSIVREISEAWSDATGEFRGFQVIH